MLQNGCDTGISAGGGKRDGVDKRLGDYDMQFAALKG